MNITEQTINLFKWLKRSAHRPAPDAWADGWWYGTASLDTKSGINLDQDSALRYSAVWACVRVISEDLASLPLLIYRRQGTSKERANDHSCYRLLHDAPNPEMSAMQFRECLQSHILLWGNAYAEIQRNLQGKPMALWPLKPDAMEVKRDESNELIYEYRLTDTGEKVIFRRDQILHIAGLGFNGLVGYSPISYMREAISLGLVAEEYGATFFKNDAAPRIALKHPGVMKEEAIKKLRDRWQATYGGSANAGKVAIIEEAMSIERISMPNVDSQFLETRKFQLNDIARIFRVPPHKIMDLERATFSNIEHQGIDYVVDTIRPWAVRWEQAINAKLLNGSEEYFAEHLMDGLMRGDIKSRYDAYAVGRQWGWLSVNDIRSLENMNPVEEGDDYLQPLNYTKLGGDEVLEVPERPEETDESGRLKIVGRK